LWNSNRFENFVSDEDVIALNGFDD